MIRYKETSGNILMFILWLPFFATSIDSFIDLTQLTNKIVQLTWIISIFCVFQLMMQRYNPPIIRSGLLLSCYLILYGIVHLMFGENLQSFDRVVPKSEYLVGVISSLLPVFLIYYYSHKGLITENIIRKWSVFFIGTLVIAYFNSVIKMQFMTDAEQFTNNIGYVILRSIPFLLFWYRRPIIQYILFVVLGILIINALKRGPILIWLILFCIFIYKSYKQIKIGKSINKIWIFLLPAIIIAFAVYYFNNALVYNEGFMNRLSATLQGDDSGRAEIYNEIWHSFHNDSNLVEVLFGHGADATIKLFSIHAHNDWLEILINQGVLGVLIYFIYYLSFFSQYKAAKSDFGKTLLLNVTIIIALTSLFSMSYMAYDCSIHILLGYGIFRSSKFIS